MNWEQISEELRACNLDPVSACVRVTRREAIAIAAGGIAILTSVGDRAQADSAEGQAETSEHASVADRRQAVTDDGNPPRTEQRSEENFRDNSNIQILLGSEFRAPTCGFQGLSASQLDATRTREGPPDRGAVGPGEYFSDGFNRKLFSSGESPLATALRAKLPDRITISIGAEKIFEQIGKPGLTPFLLTMREFSQKGAGVSHTLGIGSPVVSIVKWAGRALPIMHPKQPEPRGWMPDRQPRRNERG